MLSSEFSVCKLMMLNVLLAKLPSRLILAKRWDQTGPLALTRGHSDACMSVTLTGANRCSRAGNVVLGPGGNDAEN